MKATGMIRRMDDLGRVVIPKEIRRTMHWHEGEALEIYAQDEGLVMKKYSAMATPGRCLEDVVKGLYPLVQGALAACDTDAVLVGLGALREATGQTLAVNVAAKLRERGLWTWHEPTPVVKQGRTFPYGAVCPIVVRGDLYGGLLWGNATPADEGQLVMLRTAAAILQQQLDV